MLSPIAPFELLVPRRIVFGAGKRAELPGLVHGWGSRCWIVCGSRTLRDGGVVDALIQSLRTVGIRAQMLALQTGEPTVADIDRTTAELRRAIDQAGGATGHWILALGGGSAIDCAKAVAAMINNAHGASVAEFLEGIGTGRTLDAPSLPVVALPTTAGTGSEATKNAVITSTQPAAKKSLRSPGMIPALVIVDPELALGLSSQTTAWSGMDAVTQLLESCITRKSNAVTRGLALAGLKGMLPALRTAVADGGNPAARTTLAQGALLSGIALANSGLGMAHGVAAALGALCGTPHGLACAVMLTPTLRFNRDAYREQAVTLAEILCERRFDDPDTATDALIEAVQETADAVGIPRRLRELDVTAAQIPALVVGSRGNSMNGNPRTVDDASLTELLEELL